MFFTEEEFEQNSLFGGFDKQIKLNQLKSNEDKFEILTYLNYCETDTKWYIPLMEQIIEKDQKLRFPHYHNENRKRPPYQNPIQAKTELKYHTARNPEPEASTSFKSRESISEIEPASSIVPIVEPSQNEIKQKVVYAPKSPEEPPKNVDVILESEKSFNLELETPKSEKAFQAEPPKPVEIKTLQPKSEEKKEISLPKAPAPIEATKQEVSNPPKKTEDSTKQTKPNLEVTAHASAIEDSSRQLRPRISRENTQNEQNYRPTSRTDIIIREFYPFRFKLPYPKKSVLNSLEQKEYLDFHFKFFGRTKLTKDEVKLYKKYIHLKNLVDKERAEFFDYSKDYFKHAQDDYGFRNRATIQYINEMIDCLEKFSIKFDKYYQVFDELPLIPINQFTNQRCNINYAKSLVQLGNIPKIVLPSITIDNQPTLTIDYHNMSKRIPVSKNSKKLVKIPLVEDLNAEKLALKYDCNIVMSNSAFIHLIYNLSGSNIDEFKMPFEVKNLKKPDGSFQKVVFIEKPFVQKMSSKRETNEKFYKRALIVNLTKPIKRSIGFNRKLSAKESEELQTHDQESTKKTDTAATPSDHRKLENLYVDYASIGTLQDSFGFLNKGQVDSKANKDPISPTNSVRLTFEKALAELCKPSEETDPKKSSDESQENQQKSKEDEESNPVNKNEDKKQKKQTKRLRKTSSLEEDEAVTKKPKINYSSDEYDDYDNDDDDSDEDEETEKLIIDQPNNSKSDEIDTSKESLLSESNLNIDTSTNETPKSTQQANTEPDQLLKEKEENTNKEKSVRETVPEAIKPMILPVFDTEKPNLFDLITKMQEKLITNPSTSMNMPQNNSTSPQNKPQHSPVENARDYDYIENKHDNLNYCLWTLNLTKPVKILVRSSIDGYVNTETSSVNRVVLYPKLEYQPQFGCERLSKKDRCIMWAKSFLRSNCDVFLCRINVFTNKLISVTKLKHDEILSNNTEFNPNHALNHLRFLFEKMLGLNENNYLLVKDPNETKLVFMKSVNTKVGSFDLHFFFQSFNPNHQEKPSNWIPIDPELFLPLHYKLNRVPGLFEPEFVRRDTSKEKKPVKKPRKKNKRKPKQKNDNT